MSFDYLSLLFAKVTDATPAVQPVTSNLLPQEVMDSLPGWAWTLLRLFIAIPLPVYLGYALANWLRMRDHGWRLALALFSIFCGAVILESGRLNLGVDLKGGVILVYEIDQEALQADRETTLSSEQVNWNGLIQALNKRINPAGTKEIVVRRYGDWQVEIIVPEVDQVEIDRLKKLIQQAGSLEFRIVANARDHQHVIAAAEKQEKDSLRRRAKLVFDDDDKKAGYWARLGRDVKLEDGVYPLKVSPYGHVIRNALTGDLVTLPPNVGEGSHAVEKYLATQDIKDLDILMAYDDGYDVTGNDLGMVSRGFDEYMSPCVNFGMRGEGVGKMGGLTGSAIPTGQPPFYRLLGIMLDGELLSAPRVMSTISDRGRITGRFTQPEVDFLVGILQAGSLPAAMKKSPISENQIGAVLGEEEIRKGSIAAGGSLVLVILFMLYWYRLPGFIAAGAMVANLILTLAVMIPIQAPLTLPGLAGLVLTVGMSVDANVLIYERMREELDRGCALRMAIRNGFDRAWTTILDSNVTTIVTAVILYVVGTDQLKGFGVTLTLGLCISMFTAVFCSRVAFEICERKGVMKQLRFRHLMTLTNFDFMKVRNLVFGASALVIVLGLVAAISRGKQLFAVDFLGGTSVTMVLEEPLQEREIRTRLDQKFDALGEERGTSQQYSVNRVDVQGRTAGTWWKIDSSLQAETDLQNLLQDAFSVAHYSLKFDASQCAEKVLTPAEKPQPAGPDKQLPAAAPEKEEPAAKPAPTAQPGEPEAKKPTPPDAPKPEASPPKEPPPVEPKPEAAKPAESKPDAPADKPAPSPPAKPDNSQLELLPHRALVSVGAGDVLLALAAEPEKPAATPEESTAKPAAKTEAKAEDKPAAAPTAEQPEAKDKTTAETPPDKPAAEPAQPDTKPTKPAAKASPEESPVQPTRTRVVTTCPLEFGYEINGRTLEYQICESAGDIKINLLPEDVVLTVVPEDPNWTMKDAKGYKAWRVSLNLDRGSTEKVLGELQQKMIKTPVWPSSSKIGSRVADDTQVLAIVALIAAFLGVALYVWIRFQNLIFGIAAVVALVHDVLMAVAAVAFSYWLAGFLGFLQVEETKIDLNVIAALLTIIGFSINDTIVIFDRVRELRGKSPDLTPQLFNLSLNQTLSRTILTSLTVFAVVLVLYFFGGGGIHGFSFAMVIGTISGVYSTVYIASPVVLWMATKKKK